MRIAATIVTFLAALIVVGTASYFAVLLLAGPHGGLLPQPLQAVTIVLGWVAVVMGPFFAARAVWKRLGRRRA